MYAKGTTVMNSSGLHARPAAEFISTALKYKSDITIKNIGLGKSANAKSMVLMLALTITKGTKIEIEATGTDEQDAVEALISLVNEGFGET